MVNLLKAVVAVAATGSIWPALAHPGEKHDHLELKRELEKRSKYASKMTRDLEKCVRNPKFLEMHKRAAARRAAKAEQLRRRRGLTGPIKQKRDDVAWEKWQAVDHNQTGILEPSSDPAIIFGANTSCVLQPEVTVGPYYVFGEYIRMDVTEGSEGVPLHLEMQFVDTATCEPVSVKQMVDIWHCNATGVYSGVSSMGQGGLNSTFLRGIQPTDDDGVAAFDTIIPGHYTGRATHIHVTTHANVTLLGNGTFTGGTDNHVGQFFFDQDLRDEVETLSPYSTNAQNLTSNADDGIAADDSTDTFDPILKYVYLGESLSDGLLSWISIGLDLTANYTGAATPAAYYRAGGGVDSGLSFGGPPSGAPPRP